MSNFLLLVVHRLATVAKPRRAPKATSLDSFVLALFTLFIEPHWIPTVSALLKPSTLFKLPKRLVARKYRLLFSSKGHHRKPGPQGPSPILVAAIVELKVRNATCGCMRIARQMPWAFVQTRPLRSNLAQNASAPITIRYSTCIAGAPTFERPASSPHTGAL